MLTKMTFQAIVSLTMSRDSHAQSCSLPEEVKGGQRLRG